jgi:hypothetical protein
VEQLSLPYRIALVAIVVLAPLYLLVLKPKDNSPAPPAATPAAVAPATPAKTTPKTSSGPTAPGVKGLSTAVDKAKQASATSDANTAATDAAATAATGSAASDGGATAGTTSTPAAAAAPSTSPSSSSSAAGTPAATTPAAATPPTPAKPKLATGGDPSAPILAGLARGRTEVVLFASSTATDDKAVRRAVKGVDRRGGKVEVRVVPISRVGDYEAITRGVDVAQAPTVLVIGRKKQAHTIVGFTTVAELNQLVGDVRRSG